MSPQKLVLLNVMFLNLLYENNSNKNIQQGFKNFEPRNSKLWNKASKAQKKEKAKNEDVNIICAIQMFWALKLNSDKRKKEKRSLNISVHYVYIRQTKISCQRLIHLYVCVQKYLHVQ